MPVVSHLVGGRLLTAAMRIRNQVLRLGETGSCINLRHGWGLEGESCWTGSTTEQALTIYPQEADGRACAHWVCAWLGPLRSDRCISPSVDSHLGDERDANFRINTRPMKD